MLLIAHRGYHLDHPENTIESFRAAMALGFDGIETDVRVTSDGIGVLFHDRLVSGQHEVASLSHKQLSSLAGYTVPTMETAIQEFPDTFWNIEIKSPLSIPIVASFLNKSRLPRRPLITSFLHPAIEDIMGHLDNDSADLGLLIAHRPSNQNPLSLFHPFLNHINTVVVEFEVLDPQLVQLLHENSLRVFCYGTKNKNDDTLCRTYGIDGIITDFMNPMQD